MRRFTSRHVGVDLGTTAVRVAEVAGVDDSGYAVVRRASTVPMPDGAFVSGEIRQPAIVAQVLQEALKRAGVPREGFVLGTTSRFVAIGIMTSPQVVGPHERNDQLRNSRFELSPTVPLNESALSWNVRRLGTSGTSEPNELDVALLLRSQVESLTQVCHYARVRPQAIDLAAAALLRSLVRCAQQDATVATIVDMGATKTLVCTRQGKSLRSLRTIPLGGMSMTRALMTSLNLSFDDAEDRKHFMALPAPQRIRSQTAYADTLFDEPNTDPGFVGAADQLIEEVAKSIGEDSQMFNRSRTQGVQLVGAASRTLGFAERMQARLGVPVVLATPWADVASHKTTRFLQRGTLSDMGALADFATAIGLGLWRRPT